MAVSLQQEEGLASNSNLNRFSHSQQLSILQQTNPIKSPSAWVRRCFAPSACPRSKKQLKSAFCSSEHATSSRHPCHWAWFPCILRNHISHTQVWFLDTWNIPSSWPLPELFGQPLQLLWQQQQQQVSSKQLAQGPSLKHWVFSRPSFLLAVSFLGFLLFVSSLKLIKSFLLKVFQGLRFLICMRSCSITFVNLVLFNLIAQMWTWDGCSCQSCSCSRCRLCLGSSSFQFLEVNHPKPISQVPLKTWRKKWTFSWWSRRQSWAHPFPWPFLS